MPSTPAASANTAQAIPESGNAPRASTPNASACNASPASSATASPNATWQVGLPRRNVSSSMQGRSSWTSE
jgi:hypothetical protein